MITGLAGLIAGFIHVLSGPDHLSAIAPYSVKARSRSWRAGMNWGIGHAGGVILVGILAVILKSALHIELLSRWSERFVGVVLIFIGLWGIRSVLRNRVHTHHHAHGSDEHVHVHVHSAGESHDDRGAHVHTHAALAVGTLHGLAGSSHLFGVLPALALPSLAASMWYLTMFGIGTIAAMTTFSSIIGYITARYEAKGHRVYVGMMGTCSAAALVVGCFWLAS